MYIYVNVHLCVRIYLYINIYIKGCERRGRGEGGGGGVVPDDPPDARAALRHRNRPAKVYLRQCINSMVSLKSTPPQNRQLVVDYVYYLY